MPRRAFSSAASVRASYGPMCRRSPTKNVGVPRAPLASALATSLAHARREGPRRGRGEPLDVEAELAGVADEVLDSSRSWWREQEVVHLPEAPLRARRLGRLGGELGVVVHVGERQVAEDVAQVVAEALVQLAHDAGRAAAERALEVAVLDERQRRVGRPADVVALGVDGPVEDQRQRRGALAAQRPPRA